MGGGSWIAVTIAAAIAVYLLQRSVPFHFIRHPHEQIAAGILLRGRFSVAIAAAVFCSGLCVIICPSLLPGHRLEKWASSKLPGGHILMSFVHAILLYRNALGILLLSFLFSLITHGLNMSSLYFYAQAMELQHMPALSDVFFAAPVAFVANALPLPMGGLGVGEGTFGALLALCTTTQGVSITGGDTVFLLWRFWYIILGLIGLPFYLRGKKEIIAAEEDYKEHEQEINDSL